MLFHTEYLQFEFKQIQAKLTFDLFEHKYYAVNSHLFLYFCFQLQTFNNIWFQKLCTWKCFTIEERREVSRVTMATNAAAVTAGNQ